MSEVSFYLIQRLKTNRWVGGTEEVALRLLETTGPRLETLGLRGRSRRAPGVVESDNLDPLDAFPN